MTWLTDIEREVGRLELHAQASTTAPVPPQKAHPAGNQDIQRWSRWREPARAFTSLHEIARTSAPTHGAATDLDARGELVQAADADSAVPASQPWWRSTGVPFAGRIGPYDVIETTSENDTGHAMLNVPVNALLGIESLARLGLNVGANVLGDALGLPHRVLHAAGASASEIEAFDWYLMMLGPGEIAAAVMAAEHVAMRATQLGARFASTLGARAGSASRSTTASVDLPPPAIVERPPPGIVEPAPPAIVTPEPSPIAPPASPTTPPSALASVAPAPVPSAAVPPTMYRPTSYGPNPMNLPIDPATGERLFDVRVGGLRRWEVVATESHRRSAGAWTGLLPGGAPSTRRKAPC